MATENVLVTNVSGNNSSQQGLKPTEKARKVLVNIINSFKPHIILAQEGKKIFYSTVLEECNVAHQMYWRVFNEETGILYDITEFEKESVDLIVLYDELIRKNIISQDSELIPRLTAIILKSKGPFGKRILFVSYHGRYRGRTAERKKNILKDLLHLLLEYINRFKVHLFLGGDFNLEIEQKTLDNLISKINSEKLSRDMKSLSMRGAYGSDSGGIPQMRPTGPPTPSNTHLYLATYNPTGNRKNIYDHVIVSGTILTKNVRAIDVSGEIQKLFPEIFSEGMQEDKKRSVCKAILDHDPIVLKFKPRFL